MQNFYVYILQCSDHSYYVGHTDNLEKRISEHMQGTYPGYVASRLPAHLVFQETFTSRDEALAAERQIKNWSRAKKEALISGGWERMTGICRSIKLRNQ